MTGGQVVAEMEDKDYKQSLNYKSLKVYNCNVLSELLMLRSEQDLTGINGTSPGLLLGQVNLHRTLL